VNRNDVPQGLLLGEYGIPGSGKTGLAAGFAKYMFETTGKPVLYGDWENGERVIPASVPMVLWVPDATKDPLDEAQEFLMEGRKDIYSAVVTDTISSMADAMLTSISMKNLTEGKTTQRMKATTAAGRVINHSTLADYGMALVSFGQWAAGHLSLLQKGKHSLWLAHEKMVEIKDANGTVDVLGGPDIVGSKLTRSAPKLVQVLLRIKVVRGPQGVERRIQVDDDGLYLAKDRFKSFPQGGQGITVVRGAMTVEQFDAALLEMGVKVWRTVFTRAEMLRGEIRKQGEVKNEAVVPQTKGVVR